MSQNEPTPNTLDGLIADYLRAADAGQGLDCAAFVAAHPDHAAGLQSFFRDQDHLERVGADPDATLPPGSPGADAPGSPQMVRYFGDYELVDEIARGGMGVVYKARQVSLNRLVALKMILSGQLASVQDVQRFHAEAEAAANLDHPNILPIYEVGVHEGQHYFSMKLVEGGNLTNSFATLRRSVNDRTLLRSVANQLVMIARAVHFAHQRGILHRDLKPANVLIDQDGTPYVTDFGLAKRTDGDSGLTQSGAIVGTPSYMAPEQARSDKQLTTGVDVYALGAMLYEVLTGRPPFRAATPVETVLQVLEQEPALPRSFDGKVDRDLETISLKCLEKDSAKRYTSAAELADEMERWLRGEPIVARPSTTVARVWKWGKRRPAVAALIAVSGLAMVTLLIVVLAYSARLTTELNNVTEQRNIATEQQRIAAERERTTRRYWYAGDLALAQQAWQNEQVPRVLELLNRQRPAEGEADLRGFEWHYLRRLCHSEKSQWKWPKEADQLGLVAHGQFAMSSTPEQVEIVGLRDHASYPLSGNERPMACYERPMTPGEWDLCTAQYVPDVKTATSVTMRRRDLATGRELWTSDIPVAKSTIRNFVVSPDGTMVVALDNLTQANTTALRPKEKGKAPTIPNPLAPMYESRLLVRDARTGAETVHRLPGFMAQGPVFSADGRWLAIAGHEGPATFGEAMAAGLVIEANLVPKAAVIVFDRNSGNLVRLRDHAGSFLTALALAPDGLVLATASVDNMIRLWDVPTGKQRTALSGPKGIVHTLVFSADGKMLASGGVDQVVRLWDVPVARTRATFAGHSDSVMSVAFSNDGRTLISSDSGGVVKQWNIARPPGPIHFAVPNSITRIPGWGTEGVNQLAFSDASAKLVVQTRGPFKKPSIILASDGSAASDLKAPSGRIVAWSRGPNGIQVVSSEFENDKKMTFWEPWTQRQRPLDFANALPARWTHLSPDGRYLVGETLHKEGKECDIVTFDLRDGTSLPIIRTEISTHTFSPDSRHFATVGETVSLWDTSNGALRRTLPKNPAPRTKLVFTHDGTRLMYVSKDQTLIVWDLEREEAVRTIPGFGGRSHQLILSPNGQRLIVCTDDDNMTSTIKILNIESGLELLTLTGFTGQVDHLTMSPDGHKLAAVVTATLMGTPEIYVWDATPKNP